MIVDKKTIAELMQKSEKTITNWQNQKENPFPIKVKGRRGQSNQYDVRECFLWWHRRELSLLKVSDNGELIDYEAERTRLTKEQADGQALKNAVARRELAPVKLLEFALSVIAESINSIFESIPLKIKNKVPSLTAAEVEIITREVIKAKNAASKSKLDFSKLEELN